MTTARRPLARRILTFLFAAIVAAGLAGLISPQGAWAHDELVSSSPEDGATLTEQPGWIELEFSGEVQEMGAEIAVEKDGVDYSAGELTVDGTTMSSALPDDLDPGEYTITWRVPSSDGHVIDGTITFTLQDTSAEEDSESAGLGGGAVDSEGEDADQSERGDVTTSEASSGWSPITIIVLVLGILAVIGAVIVIVNRRRSEAAKTPVSAGRGDDHAGDSEPKN